MPVYRGTESFGTAGTLKTYVDEALTNLDAYVAAAAASATAAQTAQTAAETAQTAAETAETNAATSETNAGTSETNAATSATNAATSATNAATSETNAAASAAAAALSYDSFDDRYLGSKTSDPTLDNDGNALIDGALYFNTTVSPGELRVYDLGTTTWVSLGDGYQPLDADLTAIAALANTKGNVIAGSGTAWGALGVGTNAQVLTADSTQTYGVKWADAAGGVSWVSATWNSHGVGAPLGESTTVPTGCNRIEIDLVAVWNYSTAGNWYLGIGDSSGYATSMVSGAHGKFITSSNATVYNSSTGALVNKADGAGIEYSGRIVLTRANSNVWIVTSSFAETYDYYGTGAYLTHSVHWIDNEATEIDRIKLTTSANYFGGGTAYVRMFNP